ncbi:C-C motif chemokine 3-like 1 isoform X3 [Ictalurus punctatus]|uniref:C-C motif chemokine n=1 Tax=Ictalurus punctatus TaxID=7998 RepID=A0A9F7RLK5_ICTPU|nr:C-C motif chemokine 3-like 1 isoform X3 [Ictalurus punctatus]
MVSRSLLLVLLVLLGLTCLQSFTTAHNGHGPGQCCFNYQTHPIPAKYITAYEETEHQCTKPGVIFTLNKGRRVCADPGVEWVKNIMEIIDRRLFT